MKIGVNCYLLRADIGGLKQYFLNVFDWLLGNDQENTYVFFYFEHNADQLEELESTRWRENAVLVKTQEEIAEYFSQLDVYFCPFNVLWPRPASVPSVMTLVDIQEKFLPEFFTAEDLYQRDYHYAASTRAADRVITISEYSKRTIAEHHRIPAGKIIVAYLCANPDFYQCEQTASPLKPCPPFDQFLIYPANWWPHKNHDLLLRAMVRLRDEGLLVNAVFTGFPTKGGYPLADRVRELGLERQTFIAGYVTAGQLNQLYYRARMMVFPSLFEGFGMPPVEAMAAGCPVVASSATCIPEICGDAAVYFDPNSVEDASRAISEVWNDGDQRQRMIARGRAIAQQFSRAKLGQAHLLAFQEARSAWSPVRYQWHLRVYQPFHRTRVHLRRWLDARRPPANGGRAVVYAAGWHQIEETGNDWIRWTDGRGLILIHVPETTEVLLSADAASLKNPNNVEIRLNGRQAGMWPIARSTFGFDPMPCLRLTLRRGRNKVEIRSEHPGVSSPDDERFLAVAVRNLRMDEP